MDTSEFKTSSAGAKSRHRRGTKTPNSAEVDAIGSRRGASTKVACDHSTHRGAHCDYKPHPDKPPNKNTSQVVRPTQPQDTRGVQGRRHTELQQIRELTGSKSFIRIGSKVTWPTMSRHPMVPPSTDAQNHNMRVRWRWTKDNCRRTEDPGSQY